MILPKQIVNGRFRDNLSQGDIRFVVGNLSNTDADADGLLRLLTDTSTRDMILDSPKLFECLGKVEGAIPISTELYFYILLRHTLKGEGIDRADVASYTAAMLSHPMGTLSPTKDNTDKDDKTPVTKLSGRKPFDYTSDLIEALNRAQGYEWFCLATAIADQSLLLTGIFSDLLYARTTRRAAPGLNYYETIGKTHYKNASRHRLAEEFELKETLEILSDNFPKIREVLTKIREQYLKLGEALKN